MYDISNEAVQYLPSIHQAADLIQGRAIWSIKSPPVEDSIWDQVLRGKQRGGNNYRLSVCQRKHKSVCLGMKDKEVSL